MDFVVINTDAQDLKRSFAPLKIQIGERLTKGLGAGTNPEIGRQAAIEDMSKVAEIVDGADMVFIIAGMGGGTGTGASPIVAQAAKEAGALVVAFVTKPFKFEGEKRMDHAEMGIIELISEVDSIVTIPNQRLLSMVKGKKRSAEAFKIADLFLLNITGGKDVTLKEIDEAATTIHEVVQEDATIIFGMVEDETLENEIRITVFATGFEEKEMKLKEIKRHSKPYSKLELTLSDSISNRSIYEILRALNRLHNEIAGQELSGRMIEIGFPDEKTVNGIELRGQHE